MCSIRGAITIESNTKEEIYENTRLMLNEMMEKNRITTAQIDSITFTATKDITAAYPAVAAREIGITDAALMCVQEMYVEGSLPMCIRAELRFNTNEDNFKKTHVYLKKAAALRPDLAKKHIAIAIDGPSGAGKSTIAKLVSCELGYVYIDTGAMYRAIGLYCLDKNITPKDAVSKPLDIDIRYENGEQKIILNGEDVTDKIRTQQIAEAASKAASVNEVRIFLVNLQRKLAASKDVIMDGRDIGTVVLPNADVKIYLDASSAERAFRRFYELALAGVEADYDVIKKEIEERDYRDMNREHSPLKKAEDAITIDTSRMTLTEVKNAVLEICKSVGKNL